MYISFIAPTHVTKASLQPVALEAQSRGHLTTIGMSPGQPCDIAVYADPGHRSENHVASMFAITFHGLDQGYDPRRWLKEDWSNFDLGFLPSKYSGELWKISSFLPSALTRKGVYVVGWPKSDSLFRGENNLDTHFLFGKERNKQLLQTPKVIYAPTIECGGKLDEIVQICANLNAALLVKHAPYDTGKFTTSKNLDELYQKYTNLKNVYILDCNSDIFSAIRSADILVSDQSSVLQESLVCGTIPVSVTDWPIAWGGGHRDKVPPFAVRVKLASLENCISALLAEKQTIIEKLVFYLDDHFAFYGEAAPKMLDVLEDVFCGRNPKTTKLESSCLCKVVSLPLHITGDRQPGYGKPRYSKVVRLLAGRYIKNSFLRLNNRESLILRDVTVW